MIEIENENWSIISSIHIVQENGWSRGLQWTESSRPRKHSHVKILMPNVLVLGGGTFGGWLGHEGGALLTSGISPLEKGSAELSCPLSATWGCDEQSVIGRGLHQGVTILASWSQAPSLQNYEKYIMLSISHPQPRMIYSRSLTWRRQWYKENSFLHVERALKYLRHELMLVYFAYHKEILGVK